MTRTLAALADRLVAVAAPKATARAVTICREEFCFCRGIQLYSRQNCLYDDGHVTVGPCRYFSNGC
jgi:hypothetical protein